MTELNPQSISQTEQEAAVAVNAPALLRKSAAHWLMEGLLIVISVLLAFAVSEFREDRAERELTGRVLGGIRAEIEYNLGVLAPFVPMHSQWMQSLVNVDVTSGNETGLQLWFATRPPLPLDGTSPFPSLRRSAWEAAVSGGSLRLIDYDVLASLADVYGMQEQVAANIQRLANGALSTTAIYEPAARAASVRLLWLTLADIQSAEALLLERYKNHLPAVVVAAEKLQ